MITAIAQLGGAINPPIAGYSGVAGSADFFNIGLPQFLNNLIFLVTVIGGLVTIFNVLIAGFTYISASGDPKKVEEAWTKIWQSLLGLVIMASFVIFAGLINKIVFGGTTTPFNILQPTFF